MSSQSALRAGAVCCYFVLASQGASAASGDAADGSLEPVVVVATRAARPLREVSGEITVVDSDDLTRRVATSLDDVFRHTPGIDTESGGTRFGAESINIRGVGGNRVAIELDGVPLPDRFRIGSFSNATRDFFDVGPVERIEVLRGPASALYGSAALGGVVAIRTRDPWDIGAPQGPLQAQLSQGWDAADDSWHAAGSTAAAGVQWAALAGASVRSGHQRDAATLDDVIDRHDYRRTAGYARLAVGDPAESQLRLDMYRQQTDSTTNLESMLGSGRFRRTTALTGDDSATLGLIGASWQLAGGEGWFDSFTGRVFALDADVEQRSIDERGTAARPVRIARDFFYAQKMLGLNLGVRKDLDAGAWLHRIAAGVEWSDHETVEMRDALETGIDDGLETNIVLSEVFPLRDFPNSTTRTTGAYLQDEMQNGPLTIIAGLRYDRYDLTPEADALYLEDNPDTVPVGIELAELSPRLGIVWRTGEQTEWYLQYARGFRAPPFEDANIGLYIPLFKYRAISNPDLKPEKSDGIDLGFRWRRSGAQFRAGVFGTRYRDFIESRAVIGVDADGWLTFQSRNVAAARIYGVELSGSTELPGRLSAFGVSGSAFWARGENRDSDQPLNSLGPPQAVLGLSWRSARKKIDAELLASLTRRWSERDETAAESFEPPGHALVDLFVSQQVTDRFSWQLAVNNIFDRGVWRWADVRGLAPDDPLLPTLGQAGRHFSLNLRWATTGF